MQRLLHGRRMDEADSQQRSSGGLEAVYLAQRAALVRFLRARGAGDRAEDMVQELWLKIVATPSSPIADPVGYLYRSANNLMISHHRSAQRSERRDEQWGELSDGDALPSGEDNLAARQALAKAEAALRELGDRVLRTFLLFRIDGVPQREIALRMGLSLSAVEKDLQRAYRAIAGLRSEIDAD